VLAILNPPVRENSNSVAIFVVFFKIFIHNLIKIKKKQ